MTTKVIIRPFVLCFIWSIREKTTKVVLFKEQKPKKSALFEAH